MEEDGQDLTPFWLDNTANRPRRERCRRRISSFFLSPGFLLIVLLVTGVLFVVIVIPFILSFASQLFRPNIVKRSWDSVNIVLVLCALVFGLLSRNKNEDITSSHEYQKVYSIKSNPSTPHQWYDYSDRRSNSFNTSSITGLRRTSSSYPDLREVSPRWVIGDDNWRFYDDTHVDNYWVSDSGQRHRRCSWKGLDRQESEIKNIRVHTVEALPTEHSYTPQPPSAPSSPPPATPPAIKQEAERTCVSYKPPRPQSPPSPPSPRPRSQASPPVIKQKPKRTYENLPHKRRRNRKVNNDEEPKTPVRPSSPVIPPTPPPPPPPPMYTPHSEEKGSKRDRKRNAANATKDFLTSLYHKKKKKRQRQKSVESLDTIFHQSKTLHFQPPPPSPPLPPPPPPPSVLHNLFSSKKERRKRTISVPPPPPPPPPATVPSSSKPKTQSAPLTSSQASLLVKMNSFESVEESSNSGGESPLIRIPPPPPPPPFKMPSWKFVVQGDFVRIQSNHSSRCGSPDLDDGESSPSSSISSEPHSLMDGGNATGSPFFWPSPDVNAKAESFISKFRAGLILEKMNSITQRQGVGMSNLGPNPGPN